MSSGLQERGYSVCDLQRYCASNMPNKPLTWQTYVRAGRGSGVVAPYRAGVHVRLLRDPVRAPELHERPLTLPHAEVRVGVFVRPRLHPQTHAPGRTGAGSSGSAI